jgi:1-acyl-sn-glycerol-3-phosphate acyltransferase
MPKKSYSTVNLFIRSSLVLLCSSLVMPVYCVLILCALVLPLHYRHTLIRSYLAVYLYLLKTICHLDYHIEGLENIPKDRNGIIMCKHQSTWETFFLPVLFHAPAIILKKELFWVPVFGWGLAASNPIAIDRKDKQSAMQQILEQGKKCLNSGRWIIIFPEGTRMPIGVVGKYKVGGARLAVETGYPILPIAHNAGYYWPKRKFIKQPGTIHIVIGPLIESKGRSPEEVLNLTKHWIEDRVTQIDRFVDKSTR